MTRFRWYPDGFEHRPWYRRVRPWVVGAAVLAIILVEASVVLMGAVLQAALPIPIPLSYHLVVQAALVLYAWLGIRHCEAVVEFALITGCGRRLAQRAIAEQSAVLWQVIHRRDVESALNAGAVASDQGDDASAERQLRFLLAAAARLPHWNKRMGDWFSAMILERFAYQTDLHPLLFDLVSKRVLGRHLVEALYSGLQDARCRRLLPFHLAFTLECCRLSLPDWTRAEQQFLRDRLVALMEPAGHVDPAAIQRLHPLIASLLWSIETELPLLLRTA
jgi:hypothetical protein